MNREEIKELCVKYEIENYTINSDGSIDVNGSVAMNGYSLTSLPLRFGKVSGYFNINYNQLTSLEGCPIEVGAAFGCSDNLLRSLEHCPRHVGGNFYCRDNKLTMASYNHLFELGYDVERIKYDSDHDNDNNGLLLASYRQWFINGIINE